MERYSYLWGTQGKNYCELGSSQNLLNMLRSFGTTNPELALDEVRQMMFDFHILPGYADQKEPPLAVRYTPVYLNKRPFYALRQMVPFAAVCVNGLEHSGSERESIYSYLTLIGKDELQDGGEYSWMDQIFGGRLLTMQEEDAHKRRVKPIDFDEAPQKVRMEADDSCCETAIRVVWELYQNINRRIVIRLEKDVPFNRRAFAILRAVYGMLPVRMAAETGFSVYEKPENIQDTVKALNTRIFILPAECQVDPDRHFPENTAYLDYSKETVKKDDHKDTDQDPGKETAGTVSVETPDPFRAVVQEKVSVGSEAQTALNRSIDLLRRNREEDQEGFEGDYRKVLLQKLAVAMQTEGPGEEKHALLKKWWDLSWEKRKSVITAIYTDDSRYFEKEYYYGRMESFFDNAFFKWENEPKIRFSYSDETEDLVKETVALYKEYRSFPICRALPWVKDAFAAQIPNVLSLCHSLRMLREAMQEYNTRSMSEEAHRKCQAYILWLKDMEARRARQKAALEEEERTQREKTTAENKPQVRDSAGENPQKKASAEEKPQEKDSAENKPQEKASAEEKLQEKDSAEEKLQEKDSSEEKE